VGEEAVRGWFGVLLGAIFGLLLASDIVFYEYLARRPRTEL
jgi:hypothetical protein